MEDPIKVQLPSCNRVFVVPQVEGVGGPVVPTLFQDPLLDFCNGPAIKVVMSRGIRDVSLVQPTLSVGYRVAHRLVETSFRPFLVEVFYGYQHKIT